MIYHWSLMLFPAFGIAPYQYHTDDYIRWSTDIDSMVYRNGNSSILFHVLACFR